MATATEALAEEDEPKESMTTTEASAEESEETTRLSECLRWRRRQCICGPRELTMTTVASTEEGGSEDSTTTTKALVEDEE